MIIKNRLLIIIVMVAMAAALACDNSSDGPADFIVGSGNVVSESRQVSGFHGISVSGISEVSVELTGSESLTITTDDNILEHLVSEVVSGILFLGPENNVSVTPSRGIVYSLTANTFDKVELSGSVSVRAEGIDDELFEINMSGACTVQSEGRADRQNIAASGSCIYNGERLESRIVTINVSGTTYMLVRVSEILEGQASGSALIEYIGNPTVNVTVSGSAVVRTR